MTTDKYQLRRKRMITKFVYPSKKAAEYEIFCDTLPGIIRDANIPPEEIIRVAGISLSTYYRKLRDKRFSAFHMSILIRAIISILQSRANGTSIETIEKKTLNNN